MVEIRRTRVFTEWFRKLRDERAKARIDARVSRLENGLFGDVKYFQGIGELRIDHGPGYRVYFATDGERVVVLLCGGDKRTQTADIRRAKQFWSRYRSE